MIHFFILLNYTYVYMIFSVGTFLGFFQIISYHISQQLCLSVIFIHLYRVRSITYLHSLTIISIKVIYVIDMPKSRVPITCSHNMIS